MLERMLALPEGTEVEIRAPVFKYYGEDWPYLFDDVRTKGYRRVVINGQPHDLSDELSLDEEENYQIDVIVDRFVVRHDRTNRMDKQILAALDFGLIIGDSNFHPLPVRLLRCGLVGRPENFTMFFFVNGGNQCMKQHINHPVPYVCFMAALLVGLRILQVGC